MADSNSEPPRCSCGFWGSAQTNGLCSKCYKDQQKKSEASGGMDKTGGSSMACSFPTPSASTNKPASHTLDLPAMPSSVDREKETSADKSSSSKAEDSGNSNSSAGKAENGETPGASSNKRDRSEEDSDRPVQKNKKRCFVCNCRLELAVRQIGKCKCDYVFCPVHRLPEQHDCTFDHKEKGRAEAREKMVSPKKHMGTSLKRIDSDS